MLKRANDINGVYAALSQKPLQLNELDEFYQETYAARGGAKTRTRIERLLKNSIGDNQHILIVGYGGCGKSTELKKLEKELQSDFLIFNFSVFEELDPNSVKYLELIIVTMERLFSYVDQAGLNIKKSYLKGISNFLLSKDLQTINERYVGVEVNAEGGAEFSIPFITKYFIKLKGALKGSRSIKTILTEEIEPKFSELIGHCNMLINEIKLQLPKLGKKDLIIIIEDLDKIKLSEAQAIFYDYASQITEVKANVIYTFPIALRYNIQYTTIKSKFDNIRELPMIKVAEKDGETKFIEGIETMKKIIAMRMDLKLFENENILYELIQFSGGCLRDLFLLVKEAAEFAIDEDRQIITTTDKKEAINHLEQEYKNTIADNVDEDGEVLITAKTYYEVLLKLYKDPDKKMDNTQAEMDLRQNLTILGYKNSESWCNVHPILKSVLNKRANANDR